MRTATIYNFLLEANLMASAAILLMLLIRKTLRKPLGSGAIRFGWLLAAVRLLCPLTLPNPFIGEIRSAYVSDLAIRPIASQVQRRVEDGLGELYWIIRRDVGLAEENAVSQAVRSSYLGMGNGSFAQALMLLYLIGVMLVTGWFVFSNIRFQGKLKAGRIEELSGDLLSQYQALCSKRGIRPLRVYLTDPLPSACLVGVFRPWIALPLSASPQDAIRVLEHEICHYKGGDHWWALVRLCCCALHWFNPLVWLGAKCSRIDGELHCDERVIRDMDQEEKQQYAGVLVLAAARKCAPGIPVLATGMTMTGKKLKSRVQGIVSGKKPLKALSLGFMIFSSMLLVCAFATAEYFPLPSVPEFHQEMLPPIRPVSTPEEAIVYAKQIPALPHIQWDAAGATWTAEEYPAVGEAFRVRAERKNGDSLIVVWLKEGGIHSILQKAPDSLDGIQEMHYSREQVDWEPRLREFAQQYFLAANPALEGHIQTMGAVRYMRNTNHPGEIYATLECWYDEVVNNSQGIYLMVQLAPEFRILECSPGNG